MKHLLHQLQNQRKNAKKVYKRANYRYVKRSRLNSSTRQAPLGTTGASTTSILIPADLLAYFTMRVKQHGAIKYYFEHLLFVYGLHLDTYNAEPHHGGCKKLYQKTGQQYSRFDFKANADVWEQMRNLSYMYGPSICWLFVHLMLLERSRWEQAGRPDLFQEAVPERPGSANTALNSNQKSMKALQNLQLAIENAKARTIVVRIMDQNHRYLTRFGEIHL